VGQRLKEFQRTAARASGASTMYWTCDPLVARNAHLNFNKLRVSVDEYIEDMYGASESDLHRGLGTDRFVVAWPLADLSPADPRRADVGSGKADSRILNPDARVPESSELARLSAEPPRSLRVEIPLDIVGVRDSAPTEAAQWRASTREAFGWLLANGYAVDSFVTDTARDRGYYLLVRDSGAST
jgi:predicted GNAT superfamily acetyltransferase